MERENLFCPWDARYYGECEDLIPYLSAGARFRKQAMVEGAIVSTFSKLKLCPPSVADEVGRAAASVKFERAAEIEKETKHDIRALVLAMRELVSEEARPWIHQGATSYDIVDTANSLCHRDAAIKIMIPNLLSLARLWADIALSEKGTVQIGRTHGQWAVPTTFGYAMCWWLERLVASIEKIQDVSENLIGKFSGAVGTYAAQGLVVEDPIAFESALMETLGLPVSKMSTQIAEPEPLVGYAHSVISCLNVLGDFANTMRQLQRSEIAEVGEPFDGRGQVGSSTMPQKRNPWEFEHVVGLARTCSPHTLAIASAQFSEHQRDLTNSVPLRFYPMEDTLALNAAAKRLNRLSGGLEINRAAMAENLGRAWKKAIAEPLQILLSKYGLPDAHETVRKMAMHPAPLKELAFASEELKPYFAKFTKEELELISDPKRYTGRAAEKTESVVKDCLERIAKIEEKAKK